MNNYVTGLIDISFQEINIHFSSHSKVCLDQSPYDNFEKEFLDGSVAFYHQQFTVEKSNHHVFNRFLEIESGVISQMFLNRTYLSYYNKISSNLMKSIEEQITMLDSELCQISIAEMTQCCELTDCGDDKQWEDKIALITEIISSSQSSDQRHSFEMQGFEDIICHRFNSISEDDYYFQARNIWKVHSERIGGIIDMYSNIVKMAP